MKLLAFIDVKCAVNHNKVKFYDCYAIFHIRLFSSHSFERHWHCCEREWQLKGDWQRITAVEIYRRFLCPNVNKSIGVEMWHNCSFSDKIYGFPFTRSRKLEMFDNLKLFRKPWKKGVKVLFCSIKKFSVKGNS